MGLKASDIYGASVFGTGRTQDETQPQQSKVTANAANDQAKGKGGTSFGMLAILVIVGILVGAKFALEK